METIWLQRPGPDVPWGFRLQGGREFGQPLSVQRVTPGSVSSIGLRQGDIILKINNNNVTNVFHADGQELIRSAGDMLQLTIKRGPPVAASAPVSPTPLSQQQQFYKSPPSPTSLRSFSPVSDGLPNYQRTYYTDDPFELQRQFASLPRHATTSGMQGSVNYQDSYGQPSYRQTSNAPYGSGSSTMPKPTPYRPSGGNMSVSHMRSGSDSSGYQTSSYNQSPNTFDTPSSPGYLPDYTVSAAYRGYPDSAINRPGPGINPPSYQSSIANRRDDISSPSYSRQNSIGSQRSAFSQNENYSSQYEGQRDNQINRAYEGEQSYSPYQRQNSRGTDRQDSYNKQYSRDYSPADYVGRSNAADFQRQTSSGYQRQPSYGSSQPSNYDTSSPSSAFVRQTSQSSNIDSSQQRDYNINRQTSREANPTRGYQRQTSSGSCPQTYEATVSSPNHGSGAYFDRDDNTYSQTKPYERQSSATKTTGSTGINSLEDILSPFDKFDSHYYNEFLNRPTEPKHDADSGVVSDISEPFPAFQSPTFNYSSNKPYSSGTGYNQSGSPLQMQQQHNQYPQRQSENDYRTPGDGSPRPPGGQERVPDKILNQMSKQSGNSPKPFAYITGGIDLKEFRKKNRQAPPVMPKAYKGPNVEEQQAQQPQMHVVKGHHPPPDKYIAYSAGTPEPAKDLQNSEVLKMIQASENQGKRVISPEPETKVDTGFIRGQNYGMSFKVLQWMTETDKDNDASEDVNEQCKQQPRKTGKQRNPLMRHNSEDDEMRFSGLNKKTDIPSKTFMMLNKMSVNDDQYPPQVHVQGPDNEDQDDEEQVGRYDQKSIRYMGKNIPSPSFRLLQSLAKEDENARNNLKPTTTYSEDDLSQDDDDGLPDTLSGDENPRYMGSHIPSKSFKYLQHSIGQDENKAIQNVQHRPKARHTDVTEEHEEPTSGDENPRYMGSHIPSKSFRYLQMSIGQDENQQRQKPEPKRQEEPQQKRSLKIITTSRAVNPTEEETPSTDF